MMAAKGMAMEIKDKGKGPCTQTQPKTQVQVVLLFAGWFLFPYVPYSIQPGQSHTHTHASTRRVLAHSAAAMVLLLARLPSLVLLAWFNLYDHTLVPLLNERRSLNQFGSQLQASPQSSLCPFKHI
jgi:hypothetical protein